MSKLNFALLNLYTAQFTDANLWMNFREQDLHRHVIVYNISMLAFIMGRSDRTPKKATFLAE